MQFKSIGGATPPDCAKETTMKLGDIKIESIKIMFVSTHTDLTIAELENAIGAQEIVMEYNTLQAKIKLLEEKCAAKDETIQALKMTIDVLSSKANK